MRSFFSFIGRVTWFAVCVVLAVAATVSTSFLLARVELTWRERIVTPLPLTFPIKEMEKETPSGQSPLLPPLRKLT